MKKKGFTLIELLATIVILSIIALITVPIVIGVMEKSRKSSFSSSVTGIVKSVDLYQSSTQNMGYTDGQIVFTCDGTECKNTKNQSLAFKGETPKSGQIILKKDSTIEVKFLKNDYYCANGVEGSIEIAKECYQLDTTGAELEVQVASLKTDSIRIVGSATDVESGIKTVNYYIDNQKLASEDFDVVDTVEISYSYNSLKSGSHTIKVEVINGNGVTMVKELTVETALVLNPTITITNTPTSAVNGYRKKQVAKVDFIETNITNPEYFIKMTNRGGTISSATLAKCSSDSDGNPTACTNESVTSLELNTWYKVSGDLNVTYDGTSTITGTLIAMTYDGTNYSGSTSASGLGKTDNTAPNITPGTVTTTTNKITISYTTADEHSGLGQVTCQYGTSTSYGSTGVATTTGCTISGVTAGTTYYYRIIVLDRFGNQATPLTGSTSTAEITNPIITITNTPTASVNGYYKSQVAKVDFIGTNITNPEYFIKTTKTATTSSATVESCSSDSDGNPTGCTTSTVTSLVANKWYKVSGDLNITYDGTSSTSGTLIAMTYDGTSYSGSTSSSGLGKTDNTAPTCTSSKTNLNTTSGVTATFSCADENAGITTCTSTKSSLKTTSNYTITDDLGNSGTCSVTVSSKTQYRKRACSTGKSCPAAGCSVYNSCANGSACGYTYSCSSGTLSGTNCVTTSTSTTTATATATSCSNGYTLTSDRSTCYKDTGVTPVATYTYSCKNGFTISADYSSQCYKAFSKSADCTSACSSVSGACQYYKAGEYRCIISSVKTLSGYSCSAGAYNSYQQKCLYYNQNYRVYTYSCSSGTLSGTNCITTTTTTKAATATAKSCPNSSCTCNTYNASIATCGCSTWGSYTTWSDTNSSSTYCTTSNSCEGQTQTVYY